MRGTEPCLITTACGLVMIGLASWASLAVCRSGAAARRDAEQRNYSTASPTPTPLAPVLLTEDTSIQPIALDSVIGTRGPFRTISANTLNFNQTARVSLFAANVELLPGEDASIVTAKAEDYKHRFYALPVEYVGKVSNFDWLTQIVVSLNSQMETGDGTVWVNINVRGIDSNKVLLSIRNPTDDLYKSCGGDSIYSVYPGKRCANESCVADGLEAKVFAEWKKQFLAAHGLSQEQFNQRIIISDVSLSEGPIYVFWSISYVFVLDWVRSHQVDSVNLGAYPLAQEPGQIAIESAVRLAIRPDDQFNMPSVAPISKVQSALEGCLQGTQRQIDWCHNRFGYGGRFLVWGLSTIDERSNQCKGATADLATGEVVYCYEEPCYIE